MVQSSRRDLLRITSVTVAGSLAGCTGDGGFLSQSQEDPLELAGVEIQNTGPEPHTVHVMFIRDGKPIYWRSKRVPGATDESAGFTTLEGFPTEPEDAVFFARADGQQFVEKNRRNISDFDASCLVLRVQLEPDDQSSEPYLSIWKSTDGEHCENTPSDSNP